MAGPAARSITKGYVYTYNGKSGYISVDGMNAIVKISGYFVVQYCVCTALGFPHGVYEMNA
jgi:hypothetical protein